MYQRDRVPEHSDALVPRWQRWGGGTLGEVLGCEQGSGLYSELDQEPVELLKDAGDVVGGTGAAEVWTNCLRNV